MEPLTYHTEPQPTAQSTPQMLPPPKRGHGFLTTLIILMIISLGVWGYFLYCVPQTDPDEAFYSPLTVTPHNNSSPEDTSQIEADLNAAGEIDNSADIEDIEQAFN